MNIKKENTALHHFVHRIVGSLSPANHDGALSNGTVGELVFDGVNHKRNPFIHQAVEIGGLPRQFHHHSQSQGHEKKKIQNTFLLTESR